MRQILFFLTFWLTFAHAEVIRKYPSMQLLESHIPIIDIRTPGEWRETGLLKGAIPIMFFDEHGRYDLDAFLKKLSLYVSKEKPFALICNTGNRSRIVSTYLDKELGYKVIDLQGGMVYVKSKKLPTEPYKAP